ncbi:MAG: Eco57I restriction-modification methylase domain-containing protein [Planctomycetaceae bacterium]|jgi:type I restriction-modification system DNA methylase subunit|nr:Eco57I restriction-modification methylase domain-containing protein [Planctomycetaceae bacterium]
MPTNIFQAAILTGQITFRQDKIETAFDVYQKYFLNEKNQEAIRNHKEEEYKPEFIRRLFVDVLGYTRSFDSPDDFNLRVEQKNEDDQKKADAAILVNNDVRGVIEIKDTRTFDLGRIQDQAFGYKNHHKNAIYVATTNFEKLRFYIDYAGEYLEWNLFTLDKEAFGSLWVCLAWDSIQYDVPKRLKTESIAREEEITKDFYAHYKQCKNDLFNNLLENNPDRDKLTLFMQAQKLLDRTLFIRFAEDRGLLPPNTIAQHVIKGWETICLELGEPYPLYEHLKKYFGHLDKGHENKQRKIFGYNGGLFQPDAKLDSLKISDEVLRIHLGTLCQYDFNSDVDVNILGHIFEHSLSEIEAIKNELAQPHERTSPKESKRKKEGIFYTPSYITKYIVEQTVGKLCNDKKRELEINDEWLNETIHAKKKRKNLAEAMDDERLVPLNQYREYLLSLTICDPACGSGAFLNAAFDFLKSEHKAIDEMTGKIVGIKKAPGADIDNEILRRNLYGVDVNEEGVEITRLALWFHSAKRETKLCFLESNIKCGNSLISDPNVAGDKAFDWHKEFPKIFNPPNDEQSRSRKTANGFDIVLGNPPYFNIETLGYRNPQAQWIQENYPVIWQKKSDILFYFIYKALELSKSEVGFIVSNAFLFAESAKKLRNHILQDGRLSKIVNFEQYMVFPDADITTGVVIFNRRNHPYPSTGGE